MAPLLHRAAIITLEQVLRGTADRERWKATARTQPILGSRMARERVNIPEPGSILTTPGGKPALTTNSANFNDVSGVTCE